MELYVSVYYNFKKSSEPRLEIFQMFIMNHIHHVIQITLKATQETYKEHMKHVPFCNAKNSWLLS